MRFVDGIDPVDVLDNLRLFRLAVSLGAVESLAELPCRMTHFELPREERLRVGITDELIRLAIGIEDVADLKEDLARRSRRPRRNTPTSGTMRSQKMHWPDRHDWMNWGGEYDTNSWSSKVVRIAISA